jgi:hypothetical protein
MFTHRAKNQSWNGYTDIPLALMKDDHLKNTVDVWLDKLTEAKKLLNISIAQRDINFVAMKVNPESMVKQAEATILKANEVLPHYLYECNIRGIVETSKFGNITKALQTIFDRTEEVKQVANMQAMPYYAQQEDEDYDDEEEVIF